MAVALQLSAPTVRLGPLTVTRADAGVAVAMLLIGWTDATYLQAIGESTGLWRPLGALVIALALLARSSLPIASMVGVQLGLPFWDMTTRDVWSTTQVVAFLVSSYAVGAHLPWRRAVAAHAGLVTTYVVASAVQIGDPRNGLGSVGIATFAWALGLVVHRRAQERDELAEHARLLRSERDLRARAAVAEERARIARELHDNLGHEVSVMVLHAGAVRRMLDPEQRAERAALEQVEELGRRAVGELHRLVAALRRDSTSAEETAPLTPSPGIASLPDVVQRIRAGGTTVLLELPVDADLPPAVDAAVYRVVQEGLTNAIRHAPGADVTVQVRQDGTNVAVEVTNTAAGDPVPPATEPGGWGLASLHERVHVLGGAFTAGPRSDGPGWRVSARLPVSG